MHLFRVLMLTLAFSLAVSSAWEIGGDKYTPPIDCPPSQRFNHMVQMCVPIRCNPIHHCPRETFCDERQKVCLLDRD